jgi:hypothetical protein
MTVAVKSTIKTYFETGDKPTQAQFADFIDSYVDGFSFASNPTINDDSTVGYVVGTHWVNSSTQNVFVCTNTSAGNAVWKSFATGSGVANQVTKWSGANTLSGSATFTHDGSLLTLNPSGATIVAPPSGTAFHVAGAGAGEAISRIAVQVFHSGTGYASFAGFAAHGNSGSPAALALGDEIVHLAAYGYDGSAYSVQGYISIFSAIDWNSGTNVRGTRIGFFTTNTTGGSVVSEKVRIWADGGLTVGNVGVRPVGVAVSPGANCLDLSHAASGGTSIIQITGGAGSNYSSIFNIKVGAGATGGTQTFQLFLGNSATAFFSANQFGTTVNSGNNGVALQATGVTKWLINGNVAGTTGTGSLQGSAIWSGATRTSQGVNQTVVDTSTSGALSSFFNVQIAAAAPAAWATLTAYVVGNMVSTGGVWYICIANHTSGTFDTDFVTNRYWDTLSIFKVSKTGEIYTKPTTAATNGLTIIQASTPVIGSGGIELVPATLAVGSGVSICNTSATSNGILNINRAASVKISHDSRFININAKGAGSGGGIYMGAAGIYGWKVGTADSETADTSLSRVSVGVVGTNALSLTPIAATGSPANGFLFTAAAHTALTTLTEFNAIFINGAVIQTFAAGNITTQRFMRIDAPTYAITGGASTITTAATLAISGAPIASGSPLTIITNSYALWVQSGDVLFAGNLTVSTFYRNTPQAVTATGNITSGRVKFTGSTASQTLTLPAGISGTDIFVRNAGSVAITIGKTGGDTIEGETTMILNPGESVLLNYIGTDWTAY